MLYVIVRMKVNFLFFIIFTIWQNNNVYLYASSLSDEHKQSKRGRSTIDR